jgi:hypothetical protein
MTDKDGEFLIRIAADSIGQLRRCDVFRVLDWAPPGRMMALARWIAAKRPDLKAEVAHCQADILTERAGSGTLTAE